MSNKCLFLDTTLLNFYGKTHCGLCSIEITEEHYKEVCLTDSYRDCSYFKELCEKIFADENI